MFSTQNNCQLKYGYLLLHTVDNGLYYSQSTRKKFFFFSAKHAWTPLAWNIAKLPVHHTKYFRSFAHLHLPKKPFPTL